MRIGQDSEKNWSKLVFHIAGYSALGAVVLGVAAYLGYLSNFNFAVAAFVSRRDSTIDYIRTTQDDLKDHFVTGSPLGTIDCYQGLIFLAAHCARHTLQIEEVMASPGFPKN